MAERIVKSFRLNREALDRLSELKKVYEIESDGLLLERILKDIYEIKKSKALVPYEELKETDKELKKAMFQIGRMQGMLEKEKEEKEKLLKELEELKAEKKPRKSFWARIFGG